MTSIEPLPKSSINDKVGIYFRNLSNFPRDGSSLYAVLCETLTLLYHDLFRAFLFYLQLR